MANHGVFSADIGNHGTGNSAGEGPLVLPMNVLGAIAHVLTINSISNGFQSGEGREDYNLVQGTICFHNDVLSQLHSLAHGLVHLPVAGNHFTTQIVQRSNTGQHLPLQVFQGSATASGDVGNALSQAQLFDSSDAVATANNANSATLSHGLSHSLGALAEGIHFEYAHRAIPHNHLRISQCCCISLSSFFANIQSHTLLVQSLHALGCMLSVGCKGLGHHQISGQQKLHVILFCLGNKLFC